MARSSKAQRRNSEYALDPSFNALAVLDSYWAEGAAGLDVNAAHDGIDAAAARVNRGDLDGLASMLVAQSIALQGVFASLATQAKAQKIAARYESLLGLALKAQAQSRATVQAIVDLKFPRQVAFVKQANINNGGQQQVNNGTTAPRVEKSQAGENRLLESQHGQWVDPGAAATPARSDPALATVGAVHGADDRAGKAEGQSQRVSRRRVLAAVPRDAEDADSHGSMSRRSR